MYPRSILFVALIGAMIAGAWPSQAQPTTAPGVQPKSKNGPPLLPAPRLDGPAEQSLELVEFRDLPLTEAMRILSQQSGLKIVVSAEAGKTKVSLYLQNVTPMVAVASVAQANGLIHRRDTDTGIVRIFTTKENTRDLSAFREEHTKVFTLLYPNAQNVAQAIRDLFGNRVSIGQGASGFGINPADQQTIQDLGQRFARFSLLESRTRGFGTGGIGGIGGGVGGFGGGIGGGLGGFGGGLGGYGGGLGGFGGGLGGFGGGLGGFGGGLGGFGGGYGGFGGFGNNQFQNPNQNQQNTTKPEDRFKDFTPEEIQELQSAFGEGGMPDRNTMLEYLRRKPGNIYVSVIRQNNQLMVRTSDTDVLTQICQLVEQLDVPTPTVLLEVKVLSIRLDNDFKSLFDFQFTDGLTTYAGFTTGNILPAASADRSAAIQPPTSGFTNASSNDLMFQVVSNSFRLRMQMLEDKNRITELATPLLMTANNEVSQIFVGEQVPITVGFNPGTLVGGGVGNIGQVSSTPQTTLQQVGTTLLITPNINVDRTVTLRILQENSSINRAGGEIPVLNNLGQVQNVRVDTVSQQNVAGTIVAKDGNMIAIGGLIQETVRDVKSQVPVLGNIPGLGFFFKRQFQSREKRELVILIRPFVLTTPGEACTASKALVESISIHPNVMSGDFSTMNTFNPNEVARPLAPQTLKQQIFQIHSVAPKWY